MQSYYALVESKRASQEGSGIGNSDGSTVIVSQLPVSEWYNMISNPTVADALMDRLMHNGHRIDLKGESMRTLAKTDDIE